MTYLDTSFYCDSDSCDETTDEATCCIERASCSSYGGCDETTEYVDDSAFCVGDVCDDSSSADMDECCLDRASCTGFTYCDGCESLDESALCAADTCTVADDMYCCIDIAVCDPD